MARSRKKSLPRTDDGSSIRVESQALQAPETKIKLSDLPIGARLLIRSKTDWRTAAISRLVEETETVVLTVCSPSGYSYRLRRDRETPLVVEGGFTILPADAADTWRDNFSTYDRRW